MIIYIIILYIILYIYNTHIIYIYNYYLINIIASWLVNRKITEFYITQTSIQ